MRPEQDAYGELLYDLHSGTVENIGEIVERDDGFIEYSESAETYFEPYENWSDQIKNGIQHATGSVVDIGCGAGRHSLYLQNEFTDCIVRAIDVSPKAVKVTEERGVKRASVGGLQDIGTLPEAPYDTLLLLGNNLGLLGTQPIKNLGKLADATTEDAVLIGQTRKATDAERLEHLQYHSFNKTRGRRPGCLRIRIRYKQFQTEWYDYLYLDLPELKSILNKTVWELEELYEDESSMYTVVLKKTDSNSCCGIKT